MSKFLCAFVFLKSDVVSCPAKGKNVNTGFLMVRSLDVALPAMQMMQSGYFDAYIKLDDHGLWWIF